MRTADNMGVFTEIPSWVKNYPIDLDRAALTKLAKNTKHGSFKKPRDMNYVVVGLMYGKEAEAAKDFAEVGGWICSLIESDDPMRVCLISQKLNYRITEKSYNQDTQFFIRLANMYGGTYDGWFASD